MNRLMGKIKKFDEFNKVNESNATSRDRLMDILKEKFPNAWFKPGEGFDSGYEDSIWTGEGSMTNDDIPLFDTYGPSGLYELGVHVDLVEVLDKHGWYAESYDAGTFFLWKA